MSRFDFKHMNRTISIYRVVQILLVCLLAYVAFIFQSRFAMIGKPDKFISCIISTIVIQAILFYPIYRLANRDVNVETEGCIVGLTKEALTALRKKRMLGDLWKFSAVGFFLAFVSLVPDAKKAAGAPIILAITIFSFLLMCLAYFQCFNFCAKRRMKQEN
jgi:hypothetical protein